MIFHKVTDGTWIDGYFLDKDKAQEKADETNKFIVSSYCLHDLIVINALILKKIESVNFRLRRKSFFGLSFSSDLMIDNLTDQERKFYEYQLEAVTKSVESD